ncbi:hypothetical protein C9374_000398 [Naegleria lovaniensis]|uniref:Uncharacterized protein n=1 Tax=Naegleria lovaniensis TaxID=51637 RepID=A0AA88GYX2_NAELO|nr:uncharacterized protein C9374_000398 [Naegleria lovaniensis]KAG2388234.1 hypothetical protein C9374_000398 [Naegleria lovaniensis]
MKEFNYHLPSCKLQTSFGGGLQDQVLVQLQAVCSVPSSSSSLSESEKNELISNTESDTTRITRFHVGNRYSESAVYGNVLYISGQVPDDDGKKDIEGQTEEVLAALDQRLKEAGTDKTKLLMVQIFLASMSDFDGMNKVWDQWVPKGHAPPRATVEAKLARSYWRIEIVATAAL